MPVVCWGPTPRLSPSASGPEYQPPTTTRLGSMRTTRRNGTASAPAGQAADNRRGLSRA